MKIKLRTKTEKPAPVPIHPQLEEDPFWDSGYSFLRPKKGVKILSVEAREQMADRALEVCPKLPIYSPIWLREQIEREREEREQRRKAEAAERIKKMKEKLTHQD